MRENANLQTEHVASHFDGNDRPQGPTKLHREKWHSPLCTIIVTHYNYSHLVEDALLSLIDQTHENWECIIVDDFSSPNDLGCLEKIIESIADRRFHLIKNSERLGQVNSFFTGFASSLGEFVCLLDPDDRLAHNFLESMVRAHLNTVVFCPVVSCDQMLLKLSGGLVTGTWKGGLSHLASANTLPVRIPHTSVGELLYFPADSNKWLWSSSSGLMIRRSALQLLTPRKQLRGMTGADAYLAFGAHLVGGTIFQLEPLVYRGMHANNEYLTDKIVSLQQNKRRPSSISSAQEFKYAAIQTLFQNGVAELFSDRHLAKVVRAHFRSYELAQLETVCPDAYKLRRTVKGQVLKTIGRFIDKWFVKK